MVEEHSIDLKEQADEKSLRDSKKQNDKISGMSKRLEFRAKITNMPIISIPESGKRNRCKRGNNYINKRGVYLWVKRDFSLKFETANDTYAQVMRGKYPYYLLKVLEAARQKEQITKGKESSWRQIPHLQEWEIDSGIKSAN